MNVYLTKWSIDRSTISKSFNPVAYKIGISKWGRHKLVENRFGDKFNRQHQYDLFDIEVIGSIEFSSQEYSLARAAALGMEHIFHAICPKDFFLEEHFGLEDGVLNGMSGITEFFLMPEGVSEEDLIRIFNNGNKVVWKLENKLKSFRGTVAAEMSI
jgi:hypothetical protein